MDESPFLCKIGRKEIFEANNCFLLEIDTHVLLKRFEMILRR